MKIFPFVFTACCVIFASCYTKSHKNKVLSADPSSSVQKFVFDSRELLKTIDGKGSVSWNEEAIRFSESWKSEASASTDPFRKIAAEFLDADSSILNGLTDNEVTGFLGPFENEQKNGYRFDKHINDKNEDFSCWLVLVFDEKRRVSDVSRMCP